MLRQALAITLSVLLTAPVWGVTNPLGTVASGTGVVVAGTSATVGSTLFNGDTVSVESYGSASMILTGGSRALMSADSQARFSRDGSSIDLELVRGKMEFTSSAKSLVEGSVGDVSFRPESPSETSVAAMVLDGSDHTVLYANKGDWIVTTAHDGRSMILRSGSHIEGVLRAAQDQNDNTAPGQEKKKKKRKMAVIWIGTAIAGTATGLGMAFGESECNVVSGPTCSESPTTPGN